MVGLWNDLHAGNQKREIEMVGEEPNNPLVVLVHEFLGPRLGHLDYLSENFLEGASIRNMTDDLLTDGVRPRPVDSVTQFTV